MRVLLTGATGFVGRHLYPALSAAGCEVRCATRDVDRAARRDPSRDWVELDVERPETVRAALVGCDAAFYLVHGIGHGPDYPRREAESAENFIRAVEQAGVSRVVYLGGVLPTDTEPSRHLSSRRRTGEILRSGRAVAIELRAAMIIGAGSASWTMVRDLAARLPAMILPRWLRNHSHPVAIDDVVWALMWALHCPAEESRVLDVPGPERITHRDFLRQVAALLGHSRTMVNVPVLTPRLSSYWIALVTRVDLALARELVEGVRYDLDPGGDLIWSETERQPMSLAQAVRVALLDETDGALSPGSADRVRAIGDGWLRSGS